MLKFVKNGVGALVMWQMKDAIHIMATTRKCEPYYLRIF